MPYFEIQTVHRGNIQVHIGGIAHNIPEHRHDSQSTSSQIVSAKDWKMSPILLLQTYYSNMPPIDAALTQALETALYTPEVMPIDGSQAGLAIWGITLINYIEG